jgi:Uma2 family endonuclease
MSTLPLPRITRAEYLAAERASAVKHEFHDGQVYAMSGASPVHCQIAGNLITAINGRLAARPCVVYTSDLKVRIPATNRYFYPDLTVVCGAPQFEEFEQDVLINPLLIVEVLSPSTESYDRGEKFANYRTLDSLECYVLVNQVCPLIEVYARDREAATWNLRDARDLEQEITLPPLGISISLAEVYLKVVFAPRGSESPDR